MEANSRVAFSTWIPNGLPLAMAFDVHDVSFRTDANLSVEVVARSEAISGALIFPAPLSVRIGELGSVAMYWESGFRADSSTYVASHSSYLEWFERSSLGVYSSLDVLHYVVFSDDLCIEVLCVASPYFEAGSIAEKA